MTLYLILMRCLISIFKAINLNHVYGSNPNFQEWKPTLSHTHFNYSSIGPYLVFTAWIITVIIAFENTSVSQTQIPHFLILWIKSPLNFKNFIFAHDVHSYVIFIKNNAPNPKGSTSVQVLVEAICTNNVCSADMLTNFLRTFNTPYHNPWAGDKVYNIVAAMVYDDSCAVYTVEGVELNFLSDLTLDVIFFKVDIIKGCAVVSIIADDYWVRPRFTASLNGVDIDLITNYNNQLLNFTYLYNIINKSPDDEIKVTFVFSNEPDYNDRRSMVIFRVDKDHYDFYHFDEELKRPAK